VVVVVVAHLIACDVYFNVSGIDGLGWLGAGGGGGMQVGAGKTTAQGGVRPPTR
jgi:hypothetical protein